MASKLHLELALTPDGWRRDVVARIDHGVIARRAAIEPGLEVTHRTGEVPFIEHGPRHAAYAIGALTRHESRLPARREEWWVQPFYGRCTVQLGFMSTIGDRMLRARARFRRQSLPLMIP